jgi:hypothetical protein
LQELGVISDQTKDTLTKYKVKVDEQIEIANKEKGRTPFALAIRIIQLFVNRWLPISKALLAVIKPFSTCGPRVSNIPFDPDDRKLKVDLSRRQVSLHLPLQQLERKLRKNKMQNNNNSTTMQCKTNWSTMTKRIAKTQRVAAATRSKPQA